jgi:type IV pilus assembly protein PilV
VPKHLIFQGGVIMTITGKPDKRMGGKCGGTDEKGFTLMEVLIAMTILSVGLLAIASMQITAIQTTGGAKSISAGTAWAEDRMEYLSSLPYTDVALDPTAGKPDPLTSPNYFTITYAVADNNPRANCKRITVSVQWTERGNAKSASLIGVKPQL